MTNTSQSVRQLLTRKEAADLLGVKPATLATWASTKRYNLPFKKIGRMVRYQMTDIELFLQQELPISQIGTP